jgi:hypothetical protein
VATQLDIRYLSAFININDPERQLIARTVADSLGTRDLSDTWYLTKNVLLIHKSYSDVTNLLAVTHLADFQPTVFLLLTWAITRSNTIEL